MPTIGDDSTGLRKRGQNESSENLEKYYSNIQEKLAEEMISMTRNLKDQTLAANKIIKKDTEVSLLFIIHVVNLFNRAI